MSEIQTIRKGVIYSEYQILSDGEVFWWEAGRTTKTGTILALISEGEWMDRTGAEADIIRTFGSL